MRDFFTKDVGWKVFSLLVAITIYFTVQGVRKDRTPNEALGQWESKTFVNLPVLIVSAAADVREFKVNPDTVNVTIRAASDMMAGVTEKEIQVHVDLTAVESARNLRQRVVISLPAGVTLVRATPAEVSVVVPPKKT